ncbi:hypothetical protein IKF34_03300 [Candidatus Saccharibacteria bacterium]|nr:hypothetical protein [Candidatus Saccharibacteria bacterium]
MNKEVIYIEPEDDITDIITKIEKSKEKIIALVPPKKAGVFRSVVNIKLIAKSSVAAEKTVVIVTTDPSITKLAAATKVPVTKDLKTAPAIPKKDEEEVEVIREDVVEEDDDEEEPSEDEDEGEDAAEEDTNDSAEEDSETEDEEEPEQEDKKSKKKDRKSKKAAEKLKKAGGKITGKMKLRKKLIIFGIIGALLLVLALIWAFVIAPAANVTVEVKTTLNNFSENISFTSVITEENTDSGKFYLEEVKTENVAEKTFEATGTKNVGEKATGSVVVYSYFSAKGVNPVAAGTAFELGDKAFIADEGISLSWDGDQKECENDNIIVDGKIQCLISGRVKVTAAHAGSSYNIQASSSGWDTVANVAVYSDGAMTGGTDETITVVQQSDIDKAKNEIATSSEEEEKAALMSKIKPNTLVISSSFTTTTSDAVATPAVGEEVKEGVKPTIKVTTVSSIFSIDETKVKEFITKKAEIADDQKIYTIKDPFIDHFSKDDNGYTGKLKTSYSYGPEISETSIVEAVKGKGIGEATHNLKDINGVSSVNIKPSFPWVTFVPDDANRITVNLEVKE